MKLNQKPFITKVPGILLKPGQRIQLTVSKGYDHKLVANGLMLCPVEITITEVLNNGNIYCILNLPQGVIHNVIANDESLSYCANTQQARYSRLHLNVDKGTVIRLEPEQASEHIIEKLRHTPIVLRPYFEDHNILLVAAENSWIVSRNSNQELGLTAADPFAIPDDLNSLLDILYEEIPSDLEQLTLFEQRVKNILLIVAWYGHKALANNVKEYIQLKNGLLVDLHNKCKIQQAKLKAKPVFFELVSKTLKSEMDMVLSQHEAASIYQRALQYANKELSNSEPLKRSVTKTTVTCFTDKEVIELQKLITVFEEHTEYDSVCKLLDDEVNEKIPLHQCNECGGDAEYFQLKRHNQGLNHSVWSVNCRECSSKLPHNLYSPLRLKAALEWNKINSIVVTEKYCEEHGIEKTNLRQHREKLNRQYDLIKKLLGHLANINQNTQDINIQPSKEHIENLQCWVIYMRLIYKSVEQEMSPDIN